MGRKVKSFFLILIAGCILPLAVQGSYFDWQKGLVSALLQGVAGTLYNYQNGQMVGVYDIPGGVVQYMANGNIAEVKRYTSNYNMEQIVAWLNSLEEKGTLSEEEVELILQSINVKSISNIFSYLSNELSVEEVKEVMLAFAHALGEGSDDFKNYAKTITGKEEITTLQELAEELDNMNDDNIANAWKNTENWLGENTKLYGTFLARVQEMVGTELLLEGSNGGWKRTVEITSLNLSDWEQMGTGFLTCFDDILNTDIVANEIWGVLSKLIKDGDIDGITEDDLTKAMKDTSYVAKASTYYTYDSEGYLETTWSYVTDAQGNIVKRSGYWVEHEDEVREWLEEAGKNLDTIDEWLANVEEHIGEILNTLGGVIEDDIKERLIKDFEGLTEQTFEGNTVKERWDALVAFLTNEGGNYSDANYKYFETWLSSGWWAETNDYIANTTYYINGKLDRIEGWYQSYSLNTGENKVEYTEEEIEAFSIDEYFDILFARVDDADEKVIIAKVKENPNFKDFDGDTLEDLKGFIKQNDLFNEFKDIMGDLIEKEEIDNPFYKHIQAAGTISEKKWTKGELFFVYQNDASSENYGKLQYAIGNLAVYGGEIGDIGDIGYTGMGIIVADSLGRASQVWEINPTVNKETGSQHEINIDRDNANSIVSNTAYIASLTLRGEIEYDAIDRVMWVGIYDGSENVLTSSSGDIKSILNNEYSPTNDNGLIRQVTYTYKGTRTDTRIEIYLDTSEVTKKWNAEGLVMHSLDKIYVKAIVKVIDKALTDEQKKAVAEELGYNSWDASVVVDEKTSAEVLNALKKLGISNAEIDAIKAEIDTILTTFKNKALDELISTLDKKLSDADKAKIAEKAGYANWDALKKAIEKREVTLADFVNVLKGLGSNISLPSSIDLTELENLANMDSIDDLVNNTGLSGEEIYLTLKDLVSTGEVTRVNEGDLGTMNDVYYKEVTQPVWAVNTITNYYYTANAALDYTIRTEYALADCEEYNPLLEDTSHFKNLFTYYNGGIADGNVYQGLATYQTTTYFQWGRPLYTTIVEIMPPDFTDFVNMFDQPLEEVLSKLGITLDKEEKEAFLRELYNHLIDVGGDVGEEFTIEVGGYTIEVEFKDVDNDGDLDIFLDGTKFITLPKSLADELADNEKYEKYKWEVR